MLTNKTNVAWSVLLAHMEGQVRQKREAGKQATADQYRAVLNWLIRFLATDTETDITVATATPQTEGTLTAALAGRFLAFLHAQKHIRANSKKSYLCGLRAMYNRAVREGAAAPGFTPFAALSLPQEKTLKRALTHETIQEIAALDLVDRPHLQKAADLCLFSFLAAGIPFVDLTHLTAANLQGTHLVYNRRKTGTLVRIKLTTPLRSLIRKYHTSGATHLFGIIPDSGISHEGYKACLRRYNDCLKEIGGMLTTPVFLTSYVICHTWATEALRQHVPVALISQSLGHTSEKTTRCYLAELDQSELDDANALVTAAIEDILRRRGNPYL